MIEELVKMSPKGQLVVPKGIRTKEKFRPSDRFLAFDVSGGVLFKRVNMPDAKREFEALSREVASQFKKMKVDKKDVEKAVRWARQK